VITPPLASTSLCGSMPNTACQVPAAAQTSSYCNRSGSLDTRNCVLWPNGGTPRLGLETYCETQVPQGFTGFDCAGLDLNSAHSHERYGRTVGYLGRLAARFERHSANGRRDEWSHPRRIRRYKGEPRSGGQPGSSSMTATMAIPG